MNSPRTILQRDEFIDKANISSVREKAAKMIFHLFYKLTTFYSYCRRKEFANNSCYTRENFVSYYIKEVSC